MQPAVKVNVHRTGGQGKPDASNVFSPYLSPPVTLDGTASAGCVRLRLATDPWAPGSAHLPAPGRDPYHVKLEVVP
jgi:hypothetical protein